MFIKVFESGWENAAPECHFHYVDTSRIVLVEPSLEEVDEDEYGLEVDREMDECILKLNCGKTIYANMKADKFVEKYLMAKDRSDNKDASSDRKRDEMGKMISDLTEENVNLYENSRYMKSFLEARGLVLEYSKYKLMQRNKEKTRGIQQEDYPFN